MNNSVFRVSPAAALCMLICVCAAPSQAQLASFELEPVTVTGSGTARTLGSEIAATSVLTRGDIERAGARDAVSVLNLLGTVQVEQQGGPGTLASVRIRGADTRDTLVLVDGVPLTDLTSGQALIQQIPADIIDRVEVVRGNLSALYGANATGGVIHIFTRRGGREGWQADAAAGAGTRATRSASVGLGAGSASWRAGLRLGVERTDGFSAAHALTSNPDADGNRRRHAVLSADVQPSTGHRVDLSLRHIDGRAAYDSAASFSAPTDEHRQHLVQDGATLRGEHVIASGWTLAWRGARSSEKRRDTGTSAFGPFEFGNEIHSEVLAVDVKTELSAQWKAQAGVERLSQSTNNAVYTRQSRDTDVLRAGATYDADAGSVQGNLRHDETSDFGSATSALLGGSLVLAPGITAIASVSNSFTPPTLDFLFYDCQPFSVCSNPALKPERSRNLEAGLQWRDADTLLRVTAFAVRYRDKIANALRDPADPSSDFIPQNIGRAKNEGIEASLRTTVGPWQLLAEAGIQNPVNQDTGERLVRRARRQLALRADYQAGHWKAGAGLRHLGDRPDVDQSVFPSRAVMLESYTIVDASAQWQVTSQWSVQGAIENLFNVSYEPAANYRGRPRSLFIGASWKH